jgi:transposase InsO family protein
VIALVTTDYYSDFMEVDFLKSSNFARHGIPKILVTDNGPQFISAEFGNFGSKWEFSHATSSPYHQQANGKNEVSVKIVKSMYRKCKDSEEDFWKALLFQQNTPNQIGTSPNGRILGRVTISMIPINEQRLKPEIWRRRVKEDIVYTSSIKK